MQRHPDTINSCENAEDVEVDVAFDLVRRLLGGAGLENAAWLWLRRWLGSGLRLHAFP